jgi:hypothetical protein
VQLEWHLPGFDEQIFEISPRDWVVKATAAEIYALMAY